MGDLAISTYASNISTAGLSSNATATNGTGAANYLAGLVALAEAAPAAYAMPLLQKLAELAALAQKAGI